MKLSLVLSTHAARFEAVAFKGDLAANVAKVARWGYEAVELAVRDPRLVDPDELLGVVGDNDLAVSAIGTGQAWGEEGLSLTSDDAAIRAGAIARLNSHVPLARCLGAPIILGLIRGVTPRGQSHERSMTYLVQALRECTALAAEAAVRFALEPMNRYETDLVRTVSDGLELLEQVGSDSLGLLLDTFHMNIEEPVIEDSIRACGARIYHFHVADSNRWYPGAGHLDFTSILRSLSDTGYEGYVSGEFMPQPDADTAAERGLGHLRRALGSAVVAPGR